MNILKRIMMVILILMTSISVTLLAGEPAPEKSAPPRRAGGRLAGPDHKRWFMNLEDVVAENKTHRENMQAIMEENKAVIQETIKEEKAGKKDGEKLDPEAIDEKLQEKISEVGGKLIDEQIRHQKAMIALLEKHREDAINNIKEDMKKQRRHKQQSRRQNREGRGPREKRAEEFEGSVF